MLTTLNIFTGKRKAFASPICAAAIFSLLSGCAGGGNGLPVGSGGSNGGGSGNGGAGGSGSPATTLSCNGYPMTNGNLVTVCMITAQSAPVTPSLNVTSSSGNLIGHGSDNLANFPVYARIVATAADENTATTLAKSVVVSTANGAVSATSNPVTSPEMLEVDFEVFTAHTTNLTLISTAGNLSVDNYNATLQLTTNSGNASLQTVQGNATGNTTSGSISVDNYSNGTLQLTTNSGNVSLQTVQGDVTAKTTSGNITAALSGSGWTGVGMNATSQTGNIMASRPAGYQAAFTAKTNTGIATIDSQTAQASNGQPAVLTAGSGVPIRLQTNTGNVTVSVSQ